MAYTEDIPEKVADLLFDQGAKVANMAVQTIPRAVQGISVFGSVQFSKLYDEVSKSVEARRLLGLSGEVTEEKLKKAMQVLGSRSYNIDIAHGDAGEFGELLKDQKVLYFKVDQNTDNITKFIFLDRDRERVETAVRVLEAKRGLVTEVPSDMYLKNLLPERVVTLENLSPVEIELFRHYARKEGVLFTLLSNQGTNTLIYDKKDDEKVQQIMLYTGWALTGADGARVREQLEHRIAGRSAIQIAAEEGRRELYIVSGLHPDRYVHISEEDLKLYKAGQVVSSVSRSSSGFVQKCMAYCDDLVHPVVLSPVQFHLNMKAEELRNAHTTDMFPAGFNETAEMAKANELAELVALKSGLDNDHNATWGLWDKSVSYSEFAQYESITDEDERDQREHEFNHFRSAAFYSTEHHEREEINMNSKDLDYLISKADLEKNQRTGNSRKEEVRPYSSPKQDKDHESARD